MKLIKKSLLITLKSIFECSEKEVMKKLVVFNCKRNYTNENSQNIQKDEFYYVIIDYPFYTVLTKKSLMSLSIDKAINYDYFYDYFLTEQQLRKEKLIQIQQVSSNL